MVIGADIPLQQKQLCVENAARLAEEYLKSIRLFHGVHYKQGLDAVQSVIPITVFFSSENKKVSYE